MPDRTQNPKPQTKATAAPAAPAMPLSPSSVIAPPEPAGPAAEFEPAIQTVEQGLVQTKHGFPLFVPTQMKTLQPRTPTPLVLDAWVKNQIAVGGLELL